MFYRIFFRNFTSVNQLHSFSIRGTFPTNALKIRSVWFDLFKTLEGVETENWLKMS